VAFHTHEYERLRLELQEAFEASHLPDRPSAQLAPHDLLVRVRLHGAGA